MDSSNGAASDSVSLIDRLHIDLLQAIALTELMLERWLEPPEITCLDSSTLVQQILSVLAETGGVSAVELSTRLIARGVFADVGRSQFVELLRSMGEKNLIEQMVEGDLILALEGERIVKSLDFYSAFASSKEFTVCHAGEAIGSIAAVDPPPPHDHLLLAGRRWQVVDVDTRREEINVMPARGKKGRALCGVGRRGSRPSAKKDARKSRRRQTNVLSESGGTKLAERCTRSCGLGPIGRISLARGI